MTVPIAERVYSLSEIIDDSLEVDTLSNWVSSIGDVLYLNFGDSLESIFVGDELQADGLSELVETYVGVRTVESPGSDMASFQPVELEPYWGQTTPVPSFDILSTSDTLDAFTEYDWAYTAWGDIDLTITNDLAVPLDHLNIAVRNGANATYPDLLLVELDTTVLIPPDGVITATLPLPTGETDEIDNELVVFMFGHSPGSSLPVTVLGGDQIYVDVVLTDIGVNSARAHIPAQAFSDTSYHTLEDDDSIRKALIKSGTVSYSFRNGTPLINTVLFELPDFTLDGVPFTDQFELVPNQTYTISGFDLSGYLYDRPQQDNQVETIMTVDVLDTENLRYASNMVIIDEDSSITTDFIVSQLNFSHLEGIVSSTALQIDQPAEVLEDPPENLDSLVVEEAEAELMLVNRIGGAIDLDLIFVAYKEGLETSVAVPTIQIPPGSEADPCTLNTIVTGLEVIFNVMPDSIKPTGQASISGPVDVYDTQWIEGDIRLYSPFYFAIGASTLDPEIETYDDGFESSVVYANLDITIENHVPLYGEMLIRTSHDSMEFFDPASTEVDTIFTVDLPPAILDPVGYVASAGISDVQKELTSEQIDLFANASSEEPVYTETRINIFSTNGQIVRALASDHLTVNASALMIIEIDLDGGNEEGN
jgi:hypothetical protein